MSLHESIGATLACLATLKSISSAEMVKLDTMQSGPIEQVGLT